jgi:hypothetical protein
MWCRPFRLHGRHGVEVVPRHSISQGCRDVWDTWFVTELTKMNWDSGKRMLRHAKADTMDSYVMCVHTYTRWFWLKHGRSAMAQAAVRCTSEPAPSSTIAL